MVIDFHAHVFPHKIAERAVASLSKTGGGMPPVSDATPEGLLAHMKANGCDRAVVANIATNPRQQSAVNDFAIDCKKYEQLIPFGSVHPDSSDAKAELVRLSDNGIAGIKLHADYQQFFVDDARMFPIYEKCAERGLIVLFHAGMDMGLPRPFHCTPERLARALPVFCGSTVVAAHYGGYGYWEDTLKYLCGRDIYFDTSYAAYRVPVYSARAIIDAHDISRFLFGTDHPWSPLDLEMDYLKNILDDDAKYRMVLGENARRILHI